MKFDSFVGPSYTGQSRSMDAERTINLMLEVVESGQGKNAKKYSFIRSPGLKQLYPSGRSKVRALYPLNGFVVTAIDDHVNILSSGGALFRDYATSIANDGTPVEICASPPSNASQLLIASAGHSYVATLTLNEVTQFGVPIASVGFINEFFLFLDGNLGNGFYFSEPGDATTGTSLNFISAEADGNNYIRLIVDRAQNIWLFGTRVTQLFYDNSANDPLNPFLPNLSAGLQKGTCAKYSAINWAGRVGWLHHDADGIGQFVATNGGYTPTRVSNHAVEYIWSKYTTIADAISYAITIKGHELLRIYFPTANATWEFDHMVNDWREVSRYNAVTGQYEAHRVRCACSEFGTVLGGDRSNGKVYTISVDYNDDDLANGGDRIRWERRAPIIMDENKRITYPWFEADMQTGVGDGSNTDPLLGTVTPEADPQAELYISNDWGNTFGPARLRSMGKQGEFNKRVIWTRNGSGRQRVFKMTGEAAVPTIINDIYLRDPMGRST